MLLHGFGGDATFTWNSQVKELARRHTLVVPDLLWFGESYSSKEDYSLDFQAQTIVRIADAESVDRFDLAGISYGGLVAFALASNHGDRVRRLVMIDSPGAVYTEADHQRMLDNFSVDDVAKIVIPEGPEGVRTLLELAWQRPPPTPGFVLRDIYRNLFSTNIDEKRGLLSWLDDQRQTSLVIWLPKSFLHKDDVWVSSNGGQNSLFDCGEAVVGEFCVELGGVEFVVARALHQKSPSEPPSSQQPHFLVILSVVLCPLARIQESECVHR